jgi:dethiobiotin synthetase
MRHLTVFVTGCDTGVGKTVLTSLLARRLWRAGVGVAALKPFCSGGREDAVRLREACGGELPLDEINPWHFRAPLAPRLAARREGRTVRLADVLAHLHRIRRGSEVTLIEGAGGLLSPLGEGFDARDLILALRARPLVVCPNRLGAVNQALLVLAALPPRTSRQAVVVLVSPPAPDLASRSNPALLREAIGSRRLFVLPWLRPASAPPRLGPLLEHLGVARHSWTQTACLRPARYPCFAPKSPLC